METNHPNLLATDYAGVDNTISNERTDRAQGIADALDASGNFSAKVWAKGSQVRVYVRTAKGKDCGFLGVATDLSIDRNGLSRQAGTIADIAKDVQS